MSEELREIHVHDDVQFRVSLKSDGIVYVFFRPETEIDVEFQEILINAYHKVTGGKKHPFLFEAADNVSVTKEAREKAILIENRSTVGATAILVDNIANALMANFYLKFNKPKHPYKVFRDRQEAVKWLLSLRIGL